MVTCFNLLLAFTCCLFCVNKNQTIHQTIPLKMEKIIEIRSYNLKPGSGAAFHKLVKELSLPMLDKWKIEVVAYGPSKHSPDSYYLIRAFKSMDDRQQTEDAFYGSDEWKNGPREKILAHIENYTTVVLEADETLIEQLKRLIKK